MGVIRIPIPVKLFTGLLSPDPALFDACSSVLEKEFGAIDLESKMLPWDRTEYYREEMGAGIYRKFIFFRDLIDPAKLAGIKVFTNAVEDRFSEKTPSGTRRTINLDPGYVTEAKVVLATTKDFSHRVYIGEGIFAEVTLRYGSKERSFTACDHTYFDFRTERYRQLFNQARTLLREGLNRR